MGLADVTHSINKDNEEQQQKQQKQHQQRTEKDIASDVSIQ